MLYDHVVVSAATLRNKPVPQCPFKTQHHAALLQRGTLWLNPNQTTEQTELDKHRPASLRLVGLMNGTQTQRRPQLCEITREYTCFVYFIELL